MKICDLPPRQLFNKNHKETVKCKTLNILLHCIRPYMNTD